MQIGLTTFKNNLALTSEVELAILFLGISPKKFWTSSLRDMYKNVYVNPQSGVSNLGPVGHMQRRMTVNAAQHKSVNLLKML